LRQVDQKLSLAGAKRCGVSRTAPQIGQGRER
jgi:hypothetical protein